MPSCNFRLMATSKICLSYVLHTDTTKAAAASVVQSSGLIQMQVLTLAGTAVALCNTLLSMLVVQTAVA